MLGAAGMLGHKLLQSLSRSHAVWGTVRGEPQEAPDIGGFDRDRLLGRVSATDPDSIERALDRIAPDAVLNCIGIVKQIAESKDPIAAISVNALLPHRLADLCVRRGARLIHFSTDCVFSGRAGPYRESDPPDPQDLYGRSKLLGEVDRPGCLTLRSSIVGREIQRGSGLLEWLLSQRGGRVRGYRNALYSGLTTLAMAELVGRLLQTHPELCGVWQVSADPIDKYALLCLIDRIYGLGIRIDPDEDFHCDRRLDSTPFRETTGWTPPDWPTMIATMHADPLA